MRKDYFTRIIGFLLVMAFTISTFTVNVHAQTKNEAKSIKDFIEIGFQPVGTTMYIFGGGWNEEDTGAGKEARTIGLSPKWAEFAAKQTSSYNYKDYNYKEDVSVIHLGLDCSGYVGWALYNALETKNNQPGYIDYEDKVLEGLRDKGFGKIINASSVADYKAGDVMSSDTHTWIVVGSCDDGSVVLLHSSPPGVMLTGTATPSGERNSQANTLATFYMKKYFYDWYKRFPDSSRGSDYLSGYTQFRWNGQNGLTDEEGYLEMSAVQILSDIFGSKPKGFTDSKMDAKKPGWHKDSKGWWYVCKDGTYPKSKWLKIKGVKYYFDKNGYMVTGWKKVAKKWYYFNTTGKYTKGWKKIGSKWYYFKGNGIMHRGWLATKGHKYYLKTNGEMTTGWLKIGTKWYYFNEAGKMQTGWVKYKGNWYYLKKSGAMAVSEYIDGYYLDENGIWTK